MPSAYDRPIARKWAIWTCLRLCARFAARIRLRAAAMCSLRCAHTPTGCGYVLASLRAYASLGIVAYRQRDPCWLLASYAPRQSAFEEQHPSKYATNAATRLNRPDRRGDTTRSNFPFFRRSTHATCRTCAFQRQPSSRLRSDTRCLKNTPLQPDSSE